MTKELPRRSAPGSDNSLKKNHIDQSPEQSDGATAHDGTTAHIKFHDPHSPELGTSQLAGNAGQPCTPFTNNRPELLAESQFDKASHQICTTRCGLHFAIDLGNLAVLVDVEGPPLGVLA